MKKIMTLCMVYQHPNILLGMKKRGFGAGRWNGFGGKVHEGETIKEAAKRELLEEAGIAAQNLEQRGVLEFESSEFPEHIEAHIFFVSKFSGEPTESEEMRPQWFNVKDIPFDAMWPDDIYWVPLFLAGKKFRGKFTFGAHDAVIAHQLSEVTTL